MNLIQPKIVVGVTVVIVLFLLISLAQEMNRRIAIQREVSQFEQETQAMQKKVVELENLNQYFRTDAYQDRLAREKLNYRGEGEKVVLVPDIEAVTEEAKSLEVEPEEYSIPEKWWRMFFVDELETEEL